MGDQETFGHATYTFLRDRAIATSMGRILRANRRLSLAFMDVGGVIPTPARTVFFLELWKASLAASSHYGTR
jgi:hypothetical protein